MSDARTYWAARRQLVRLPDGRIGELVTTTEYADGSPAESLVEVGPTTPERLAEGVVAEEHVARVTVEHARLEYLPGDEP